jgi:hypothetical protein
MNKASDILTALGLLKPLIDECVRIGNYASLDELIKRRDGLKSELSMLRAQEPLHDV